MNINATITHVQMNKHDPQRLTTYDDCIAIEATITVGIDEYHVEITRLGGETNSTVRELIGSKYHNACSYPTNVMDAYGRLLFDMQLNPAFLESL